LEGWSGLSTYLTETDIFIDKTHVTYVEIGEVSRKAFTIEIC
ncbi:aldose 1-epimerase family protein, partial [Streptococcus suis]